MALFSGGGKITAPLYTGDYTLTLIGDFVYMHLLTSGTLTIQEDAEYDLFCVGGGGAGGWGIGQFHETGSGGGGGYTATLLGQSLVAKTEIAVTVGSGGISGTGSGRAINGNDGGISQIGDFISAKGGKGGYGINHSGSAGGSGGGASGGYYDDDNDGSGCGGAGGTDGSDGGKSNWLYGSSYWRDSASGGKGQGTTTKAFGEIDNTLYAGGGGGATDGSGTSFTAGAGGAGGGGAGGKRKQGVAGTANSGGGGGGSYASSAVFADGGSGIAIIRWKAA